MRIDVIGVYDVPESPEPCSLVELRVELNRERLDLGNVTQEVQGLPPSYWQVPWLEHELDNEGTSGKELLSPLIGRSGPTRIAFFFHYLDPSRPLRTPAGSIPLPESVGRPERLNFIRYEPPC
jgi:hypothetical protein